MVLAKDAGLDGFLEKRFGLQVFALLLIQIGQIANALERLPVFRAQHAAVGRGL